MKIVEIVDEDGFRQRYQIEDDDDPTQAAEIGLNVGVPDMRQIDWDDVAKELNNRFFSLQLFTLTDLHQRETGIGSVITSVLKRRIKKLYKE